MTKKQIFRKKVRLHFDNDDFIALYIFMIIFMFCACFFTTLSLLYGIIFIIGTIIITSMSIILSGDKIEVYYEED